MWNGNNPNFSAISATILLPLVSYIEGHEDGFAANPDIQSPLHFYYLSIFLMSELSKK